MRESPVKRNPTSKRSSASVEAAACHPIAARRRVSAAPFNILQAARLPLQSERRCAGCRDVSSNRLLSWPLPWGERLIGFRTAPGDYLPNRFRMLTGSYEVQECQLMQRHLFAGQTILDVGANIGYLELVSGA